MSFIIAFLNVLIIGVLAWWLSRNAARNQLTIYWAALGLKCSAGLALGAIYYYHYGLGDTIVFFNDAVRLVGLLKDNPQLFFSSLLSGAPPIELASSEPRSLFFTTLLTFVNVVSGNNYWISSLWFSFFSFVCTWYLVVRISQRMPSLRMASVFAFLFVPSVVFWSSGIIKESVAFASLCFLAGMFINLLTGRRPSWLEYVATVAAIWLLISLKYYWAAVFFPSVITTLIVHLLVSRRVHNTWKVALSWLVIFVICCVLASLSHPNFYFDTFLDVIRLNNMAFVAISDQANLIHFPRNVNGWDDVIVNAPLALFSGLFRPLLFEPVSLTGHIGSLENIVLMLLTIARLSRIENVSSVERLLWFSFIAYTCLLCVFLAMSTPNFGTLSRYRIGFLPFFVMTVLHDNLLLKKIGLKDF